ncbi:MAG TPA: plastocyanin/azurin family copper-binding protein [Gemmatimonadaceae bacterium]|nr:plastocyanin/azurin family copper-binding protein [Gemmatimonadaceae bacterium]
MTATLACLFGCGGGGYGASNPTGPGNPGGTNNPPSDVISVTNDAYSPSSKTVAAGTQVTWNWNTCSGDIYSGQTCVAHSVTFDDGVTSATQDNGSFVRTFATPGTYKYHCAVHGAAMTGSITVN